VDGCVRVGNCSSEKGIAEIVNIYGLGNALYFTGPSQSNVRILSAAVFSATEMYVMGNSSSSYLYLL
jgi:hypothetical protein